MIERAVEPQRHRPPGAHDCTRSWSVGLDAW